MAYITKNTAVIESGISDAKEVAIEGVDKLIDGASVLVPKHNDKN
jgi:hypothetical protein